MPRASRADALEVITGWDTDEVVALLRKNGVEEACWKAVEKRQIDGDELLHLTEGKLALWKSDLTRPLIWNLWTFVEELRKCPENYVEDKCQQQAQEAAEEARSDTSSWDTDFEDEPTTDESNIVEMRQVVNTAVNPQFRNSLRLFQENDRIRSEAGARTSAFTASPCVTKKGITKGRTTTEKSSDTAPVSENTYANFEVGTSASGSNSSLVPESSSSSEGCMLYANVVYNNGEQPGRNSSRLHEQNSLAEKLKEQLILMGPPTSKPAITPKPEALCKRTREVIVTAGEPRKSFLHKPKVNGAGSALKKMNVPPPAEPTSDKRRQSLNSSTEESLKNLPKPPVSIRGFDLVANLPMTRPADESDEDEEEEYDAPYEPFDEQIQQQQQQQQRGSIIIRADSKQSIASARQNSVESIYEPPSHEDEEPYEIYECITESPEENGHDYRNEYNGKNSTNPPPLPANPPPQNYLNKTDTRTERALEKKSSTLPHSGSNTSLSNAARPLPPPPDRQFCERPWFHNLTREQANNLITEQCTQHNAPDGYFLMRPSTSDPNNPLTLVLWCKDRVYNVPVRRRLDNRYALGSAKPDEQSFASVDEIVPFYKKEKLNLYTGGVQTGSTTLSETPSK